MEKITEIREGVHSDYYRVEDEITYVPLEQKEIQMIHDLIYDDWTSKVDMNRKGKTPSDIPVPPLKYIDLLDKLSKAEESYGISEYQYGRLPHSKDCNCDSCQPELNY
tara:strand:+ start:29 stop:352 length:324 start_codon:yes stop_codon:yes gene_type:complete